MIEEKGGTMERNDYLEGALSPLYKNIVLQEIKDEKEFENFKENLRSAKLITDARRNPAYDMFYIDALDTRVFNPNIVYIHIDHSK